MIGMLIWDRAGHGLRPVRMKEISVLHVHFLCGEVTALERTAEVMFAFGILPRTNTYGCSRHKLPVTAEHPLVRLAAECPDQLILCPHQGGISHAAFREAARMVFADLEKLMDGKRPERVVNGL